MKRKLSVALAVLGALLVMAALYLVGGLSDTSVKVDYTATVRDPASGWVDVTATVEAGQRGWLHLYLRDAAQAGEARVTGLEVSRGGLWQTLPGFADFQTIWVGYDARPVTLRYRLKAQWMKGDESPRSYLGADFGYLRGMTTFYTPMTLRDLAHYSAGGVDGLGGARVTFDLPAGWAVVSPWQGAERIPVAALRNVYFGVGDLAVTETQAQDARLLVGVYRGLGDEMAELARINALKIFETTTAELGFGPRDAAPYFALTILPEEPIHGGAAGGDSIVSSGEWNTIAHEMFHWWNGDTVETQPEANWVKEGFTKYYEGKILFKAGIWGEAEFTDHLSKPAWVFREWAQPLRIDLAGASIDLALKNSGAAYDPVYFGGMLAALHCEARLAARGHSLDELWGLLNAQQQPANNEDVLLALEELGGPELAQEMDAMIHGKADLPVR